MTLVIATLCGCLGVAGILEARSPARKIPGARTISPAAHRVVRGQRRSSLWLALLLGCLAMLLTRWLVVGLLTGLVVLITPSVIAALAQDSPARHTEAVATWTELLRDTLSASAGLSQAIVATAPLAPPTIAGPLAELSAGLQSGVPLIDGLRVFANTAADPGVDLVVCALLLAASARAQRLTELLGALAETIREEAALQLRIEASRAAARSGIRTVVVFSALFAGGLAVLAHAYLAPFGTLVGQCVLGAIGVAYMSGTLLMVRLTRPPAPFRLIGAVGSVQ